MIENEKLQQLKNRNDLNQARNVILQIYNHKFVAKKKIVLK